MAGVQVAPQSVPAREADDQRGRQRYRQAGLTSAAAVLAKGAGMASALVTIPITAPYLGPERFGLLMTVTSIPLLLSFSDFGIGNGLLTALADAHGRQDRERSRVLVSSAFFVLTAIAIVLIAAAVPLIQWLPWSTILNLRSSDARSEVTTCLAVFIVMTLAGLPLSVPQRVQQAEQRGFVTNLWLFAGNVFSMALLIVFVKLGKGLPWLVGAVAGSPLLIGAIAWIQEFRNRQWLRPAWRHFRLHDALHIGRAGLLIFSSQVGAAYLMMAPVVLLGRKYGQESVASYALVQRILSIFVVAASLMVTPLWPAYGEALARGDHGWIRSAYVRSIAVTVLIAGIPLACIAPFAPQLANLLSSRSIRVGVSMAVAMALLGICTSLRNTISMMVNGCGYFARTAIAFPVAAVFAACALVVPNPAMSPAAVPVWVAGAELIVIAVLLSDAPRVLNRAGGQS